MWGIQMNKPGTHFGKRVEYQGIKFDSEKEKEFFRRYVENSGYEYEVHPKYTLVEKFKLSDKVTMRELSYRPDFVLKENGKLKHVIDVKNGYTAYAIDQGAGIRMELFAKQYDFPVEVVVLRTHDFKSKVMRVTKKYEPKVFNDLNYNVEDLFQK